MKSDVGLVILKSLLGFLDQSHDGFASLLFIGNSLVDLFSFSLSLLSESLFLDDLR